MKRKNVKITGDVDGEKVFEVTWTAANDDWMRAGRLKARADAGDKEAAGAYPPVTMATRTGHPAR